MLEMLLGTCKVKLDTNSMSTSDKTDVKIILKKAEAEQFSIICDEVNAGTGRRLLRRNIRKKTKITGRFKRIWGIFLHMGCFLSICFPYW